MRHSPFLAGATALAFSLAGALQAAAQPPPGYYGPDGRPDRRRPPQEAWRPAPPPPGWNTRQWNYRQDYVRRNPHRRDDHSDAIIAGILGFALGAAIAGSTQDKERATARLHDPDWTAACARRYRSFDPATGTYLGYDGLRRYCR